MYQIFIAYINHLIHFENTPHEELQVNTIKPPLVISRCLFLQTASRFSPFKEGSTIEKGSQQHDWEHDFSAVAPITEHLLIDSLELFSFYIYRQYYSCVRPIWFRK